MSTIEFDLIDLYEKARRTYGDEVAAEANRKFSYRTAERHGVTRAWTVAINRALEDERCFAHDTGAEPVRRPAYL